MGTAKFERDDRRSPNLCPRPPTTSFPFQALQERFDLLTVLYRINLRVLVDDLAVEADDESPSRRRHFAFEFKLHLVRQSCFDVRARADRDAENRRDVSFLVG